MKIRHDPSTDYLTVSLFDLDSAPGLETAVHLHDSGVFPVATFEGRVVGVEVFAVSMLALATYLAAPERATLPPDVDAAVVAFLAAHPAKERPVTSSPALGSATKVEVAPDPTAEEEPAGDTHDGA